MQPDSVDERSKCPCCGSANVRTDVIDNEARVLSLRDRSYLFHPDGRVPPGRWRTISCKDCGEVSQERVVTRRREPPR
jgi:uncharacterized Zn finger protein